jgi:hypothetical protein
MSPCQGVCMFPSVHALSTSMCAGSWCPGVCLHLDFEHARMRSCIIRHPCTAKGLKLSAKPTTLLLLLLLLLLWYMCAGPSAA